MSTIPMEVADRLRGKKPGRLDQLRYAIQTREREARHYPKEVVPAHYLGMTAGMQLALSILENHD